MADLVSGDEMMQRSLGGDRTSFVPNPASTRLVCSFVAVLVLACSTNSPAYDPRGGSGAAQPLVVVVRHLSSESLHPDRDYHGPTDFGAIMAEYIAGALQEIDVAAVALPAGTPLPDGVDLEIRGDLLHLDAGSWNLRFWIGFGAGRALVNTQADLVQVSTGQTLATSEKRARSNTWQGPESILRRTCSRVARAVALDFHQVLSRDELVRRSAER